MKGFLLSLFQISFIQQIRNAQELKVVSDNGKYGFSDKDGKIIIPVKYDFVLAFMEEGFAYVKINGKSGKINSKGKEVIL